MSENERDDIWVKGIKTIVGHHKKSLLDYADALDAKNCSIGQMKAKIHNDLSQIQLTMGILFETFRNGGNIKPFEDSLNKIKPQKREYPNGGYKNKSQTQPAGAKQA